jgi:hypothetical protein
MYLLTQLSPAFFCIVLPSNRSAIQPVYTGPQNGGNYNLRKLGKTGDFIKKDFIKQRSCLLRLPHLKLSISTDGEPEDVSLFSQKSLVTSALTAQTACTLVLRSVTQPPVH